MSQPVSPKNSILAYFGKARFFTVSLVIHVVLGLTLGGVVLFKAVQEDAAFEVGQGESFLAEETAELPPAEEPLEFEEPAVSAPDAAAPAMDASAIQTLSEVSSFQMVASGPEQTMGSAFTGTMSRGLSGTGGSVGGTGKMASRGFFGAPESAEVTGFHGTFYDLKQTDGRKPTDMTPEAYGEFVASFVKTWNKSKFNRYYKGPTKLVSSFIFTPRIDADLAPKAFGVEKEVQPSRWVVWYKARVSPPKSGTYHFVGAGDDILFVRLNGKMVLDRCWYLRNEEAKTEATYDYGFSDIKGGFAKGPAFKAVAGQFYDIDVLIGEQPGGKFFANVMIAEEGVDYGKDSRGNPIFPVFRVANETPSKEGNPEYPPHAEGGPVWQSAPPKP